MNYFKIGSRVMLRNKVFSAINSSGLVLGITGALLIFVWIVRETRVDQFHPDIDRLYKAWNRSVTDGQVMAWDRTPRVLAPTLHQEYSGIESSASFAEYKSTYLFTAGDRRLTRNSGAFTDEGFFSMFAFPLVAGKPDALFADPSSIVITEAFAKDLFGDKEPLGEVIHVSQSVYTFPFKVTGVMKDLPSDTDFKFDYLLSFKFLEQLEGRETDWSNNSVHTYVKLKTGADLDVLNKEIKGIAKGRTQHENVPEFFLYEFSKMHLYSRFENGVPAGGRIEIVRMLGILGGCMLLIACINYVNLSTARAQRRSREVGVRKIVGAQRSSLVTQFLCESVLLTLGSGVIALFTAALLLPFFSELMNVDLSFRMLGLNMWLVIGGTLVFIGVLAGAYPAFYLSSFRPVWVFKGGIASGRNLLRRILVVIQFGVAVSLIFSVIVIRDQVGHIRDRDVGYDKERLLFHFITGDLENKFDVYKNALMSSGVVESVSKTASPITENWSSSHEMEWEGMDRNQKLVIDRFHIDEHITTTMGLHLIEGRDLDLQEFPSDSTALLLNEAAVKAMGFVHPIGQIIRDSGIDWRVVGVVKDFVHHAPHQRVRPMVLQYGNGWFSTVHLRLSKDKPLSEVLPAIAKIFAKFNPAYPFEYHFVDDVHTKKFEGLDKTLLFTTIFSAGAIFIACLGLVGLSTYLIESRVKEIGIRKVFGGSVADIARLLCSTNLRPIFYSILLFTPGAWFSMQWWLQSFEYRITLQLWVLLTSSFILMLIAFLAIIFQVLSAARMNPAKTLRMD